MISEAIRSKALKYLNESGITKAQLSDEIGVNRSSLVQYLKGEGDMLSDKMINKIEEKICSLSEENKGSVGVRRAAEIYKTVDAAGVLAVCQSCQDYIGLGVVVGRSGFGKTYTLKYYAKTPKVAYIECNESMNGRDLLKALERVLALPHMTGSIDDRLDNIKDFFNSNPGYLLIIDEADKLITKYTQKKAEILRNIYDQSDVGLILAGEPALQKSIRNYIPRLANRIDFAYELEGLSKEEVMGYVEGVEFDAEATAEIIRRATNERNGCFRLLNRTYKNVMRISEGDVVGIDTVRKASSMMLL